MKGKRISREAALRVGAVVVAGIAAIGVLPGLLSQPEPPPLPADVGLGATGATGASGADPERRDEAKRDGWVDHERAPEPEEARNEGAATKRGRREGKEEPEKPRVSTSVDVPVAAPAPPNPPASAPAPAAAPAPAPIPAPPPLPPAPAPVDAPGDFGP